MPDKLTDSEIVKALECCIGFDSCEERQCPMVKECGKDIDSVYKYALDLINRLQAENERLKGAKVKLHKLIPKMIKTAKAEAYKEFAERLLKDLTLLANHEDSFRQSVILGVCNTIKFKLKELVGE